MKTTTIIFNQSDIETQSVTVADLVTLTGRKARSLRRRLTAPRIYRKELRLARRIACAIDAHPTLSNIALWLMGIACAVEVFMFA